MRYFIFKYICPVFLFLLIYPLNIYTQTEKIQFKNITDFPGGAIWCMLQDSKGFLWIGTYDGLCRYDGHKFKIFKNSPDNENSLGANSVRSLYEDKSQFLWVGTDQGGLNKYNSAQENFTRYIHKLNDSTSISSNVVLSIYEDKSCTLWVGTLDGGLNILNREKEQFISYKNNPADPLSLSNNNVRSIYEDSKGNFWIGTVGGGLNKFDRAKKIFTHYIHNPHNPNSLSHNNVTGIREDKSGVLWISTMRGGLNKFIYKNDEQPPVFTRYENNPDNPASLSNNNISSLFIDQENIIWVGTWGGGLNKAISNLINSSSLSFISYKHDPFNQFSLNDNNVSCIYRDETGLLWIATWEGGLNVINTNQKQFKHYKYEPKNPFSLSANGITAVYEDKTGNLWIGTRDGGLNKMDRVTNKITHYKNKPGDPASLSDNSITAIFEDRSGNLWIGTWNGGLNKFDLRTGKFYHYRYDSQNSKSISDDRILSISEYPSNILWIGTYHGGLNKFEKAGENFINYKHNLADSNSPSSNRVSVLYTDDSGILWIGTIGGGLDALDCNKEIFFHYDFNPDRAKTSSLEISCIYEDKSKQLWIGTVDKGLIKLNKENKKFRIYNMKDGLASDYVAGILEDDSGNLWISSTALSKFNPETESFRNYDYDNGLYSSPFGASACYKSRTGELIFGGANGLNIFHPDSIKYNTHIPTIYITDFYLSNKPVPIGYDSLSDRTILTKSMIECEEIELNYDDKVFSFEFAALDFHSYGKNKYAYFMEGFDNNWTYTDANRRLATYTNLNPGKYTFRVKGSNNDEVWNETGASIKIIILPPWWATWWFKVVMFFTIIVIGYSIYRYRINKVREMERLRVQIASDLHDDIGSALTRIAVHSEIIQTTIEKEKVSTSSKKIGDMSREVITTLSDVVWSIDARNDTVGDLIDRMRDFLETVFPAGSIHINFQTKGLYLNQKIEQSLRQNIYLIFKEAVNNAAKHSGADEIRILLVNGEGKFIMEIADNGRGIEMFSQQGGHHGLENMKMRAKRFNGELIIENLDKGTSIKLIAKNI